MKIQGGNSSGPIDFNAVKNKKEKEAASQSSETLSASSDSVDAKLSQTLTELTKAIEESGLTPAQLHSGIDEKRLERLFESFDRVSGKQPQLPEEQLLAMSDRLRESLQNNPQKALSAFRDLDPVRVSDLLSEPL